MENVKHLENIVEDSFGLWITGLFSAIRGWNPNLSFDEQKESFFWICEKLLLDGKVKFLKPDVDCYVSPGNPKPKFTVEDPDMHWEKDPKDIIVYLRDKWPGQASDESDPEMLNYFYNLPAIVWINEGGSLVTS